MDTAQITASIVNAIRDIATLFVMYIVILKLQLPYLQVLLAYVAVKVLARIFTQLVRPRNLGRDNRPTPVYGLAIGMVGLLLTLAALIGVLVFASYRFSKLEVLGLFVTGIATTTVYDAVVKRV
jgi:hypothetical protein